MLRIRIHNTGFNVTYELWYRIQVNWESLTVVQKDLIQCRVKLLYYLDILDTYEEMMGGGQRAAERFKPEVFRLAHPSSFLCLQKAAIIF
jgi:hypothetical protein